MYQIYVVSIVKFHYPVSSKILLDIHQIVLGFLDLLIKLKPPLKNLD